MPTRVVSTPHSRRSSWWLVAACIAAIAFFTLSPAPGEPGTEFFCLACGSRGGVDAVLNILLFAPLGFALALCGVRWPRALVAMALLSASIEATQFLAIPGRDATLGDIAMNTVGGSLGLAIGCWRYELVRPSPRVAALASLAWSAGWLAVQAVACFAFAPSLPATRYYGQIARSFASMATFRGTVADARVGTMAIRDDVMPDSSQLRALLERGATVSATVVPDGATTRLAPIVRIADRHREEIAILGQDGRAAIFGIRAGASDLRFRPPLFRLPGALARAASPRQANSGDTVRLSARYGRVVQLRADRARSVLARDIPITPGFGWTLILPAQWYIEGSTGEQLITSLWLLLWFFPLGYWLGALREPGAPVRNVRRDAITTLLLAGVLASGLTAMPYRFGLASGSLADWLAALAGIAAGFATLTVTRRKRQAS